MKIAIAGYGTEGAANYRYFSRDPSNELTIVDEKPGAELPEGVKTLLGPGVFERLDDFDLVLRSPGIAPRKITTDGKIWSATNEFFVKCPSPIIGVTGSKGKGTTSSLIASILEKAGKTVWLVGNIGRAALDVLDQIQPSDIVVYELSSFQLWDLERSPQTAVVLYIEQEHLDVHKDMAEYVQAKAQIAVHQHETDIVVYNKDNQYATSIAMGSPAQKVAYPDEEVAHTKENSFYYGEQKICSVDVLRIKGVHNQQNALAAIDAVCQYVTDPHVIEEGLHAFTGLPHRLEFVATKNDVDYYDDSIATTPSSAVAALNAFDQPAVIIVGGSSKGSDFSVLADALKTKQAKALFIGTEAKNIEAAAKNVGFSDYEVYEDYTMPELVQRASELAAAGGVVLLSPAAASFDHFKNYADRGDQFKQAVANL